MQNHEQRLRQGLAETREQPDEPLPDAEVKPGQTTWVTSLRDHATILTVSEDGGRVTVKLGALTFQVSRRDLAKPCAGAAARPAASAPIHAPRAERHVPRELNLLGRRVEDARRELERFLDAAILARLPDVRVVHGYGTGALREAVHAYLATAPISAFRLGEEGRDPGGSGVTLVQL